MKVLVCGVNGMIGHKIWQVLTHANEQSFQVYGSVRFTLDDLLSGNNHTSLKNFFTHQLKTKGDDLKKKLKELIIENFHAENFQDVEKKLDALQPDVIINAVGITLRKAEIKNISLAMEVNALFPQKLQIWVNRNNKRLIHLSTDCVFDGASGHYTELSTPTASDLYGKTKFLGEVIGDRSLTLRFSCIGRELSAYTELLEWFLSQPEGETIKGYSQVFYSGVTTIEVAYTVLEFILKYPNSHGLYQLSSKPLSKFELLKIMKTFYQRQLTIEPYSEYTSNKILLSQKLHSLLKREMKNFETMFEALQTEHLEQLELKKQNLNYYRV